MMTEKQHQAVARHGKLLLKLFPDAKPDDPVALCKRLHRLEAKAHRAAEIICSIDNDAMQRESEAVLGVAHRSLCRMLGVDPTSDMADELFVNHDPRGYALKTTEQVARRVGLPQDWGGYGIIAPEIGKDGV